MIKNYDATRKGHKTQQPLQNQRLLKFVCFFFNLKLNKRIIDQVIEYLIQIMLMHAVSTNLVQLFTSEQGLRASHLRGSRSDQPIPVATMSISRCCLNGALKLCIYYHIRTTYIQFLPSFSTYLKSLPLLAFSLCKTMFVVCNATNFWQTDLYGNLKICS